ncbi:MAG: (d)CMP kinase [Clostridia bacterium]|nr:(d)CMP kinase [Clostridia bacterium]
MNFINGSKAVHCSIALDGPSGAGKSTIAKAIAKDMNYLYLDTGAMYRAFGLYAIRNGIDFSGSWNDKGNEKALIALLDSFDLDVNYVDGLQRVYVCGEDYTDYIRTNEVSKAASAVAVISAVRLKMVELQRKIAAGINVVMDGRDIGTYVLPNATVKIFVTASPIARAKRRYKELLDKGDNSHTFEQVYNDMIERDKNDSTRSFAPLTRADDATLLDTTDLNLEESIEAVRSIILSRLGLK